MLGQRWADVVQMLFKCFVFTGIALIIGHIPERHKTAYSNLTEIISFTPPPRNDMTLSLSWPIPGHHLRRRPNIEPAWIQHIWFAGLIVLWPHCNSNIGPQLPRVDETIPFDRRRSVQC